MIDLTRVVCVIVVLAASWINNEAAGASSSQSRNSYTKIFEHEESVEDWKLMQLLLMMREARFNDVDNANYDSVKYWYDAVLNFRPSHCVKAHWDELGDKYYEHTQERNGGLLVIARKALIDFCGAYYSDLERILNGLVHDSMDKLKSIYSNFEYWYKFGESEDWHYVSLARTVAGVGALTSKEKFDSAWENGFCATILNKLREPEMSDYARFTYLVTQAGPDFFKYCSEPSRFWIKIVDMCQHLETAEKNYVNKERRGIDSQIELGSTYHSDSFV